VNVVQLVLVAGAVLLGLYVAARLIGRAREGAKARTSLEEGPTWWKVGGDEWLLEDVDRTVDSLVVRVSELEKQRSQEPGGATPHPARTDDVEDVRRAVGELRERIDRLERRLEELERWPGDQ
jgi:hypothetical protein